MRPNRLALAVLLAGSLWACNGEGRDMAPTIEEVRARHTERLMALPGVVSVGIGLDDQGEPAIVVGLDQVRPELEGELPDTLEGHRLVRQVIGEIRSR